MAEPIVPPDMIGAGITQQPQPSEPIRQTTLPTQTAQGMQPDLRLLQMLRPQSALPNPGLAMGSGVLGALAGARGGNQYLAQHAQMADQAQSQQMQQVQLMDRLAQRRREQQERQQQAAREVAEWSLKSDNPGAQKFGAQGLSDYYKNLTGKVIPPEYFIQSAKFSDAERQSIWADIVGGRSDAEITARNPKLQNAPGWLGTERKNLADPTFRALQKIPTKQELALTRAKQDRELAENVQATWAARNGIHKDDVSFVAEYLQRTTGRPITSFDPSNPADRPLIENAQRGAAIQRKEREKGSLAYEKWLEERGEKRRELSIKEREAAREENLYNAIFGGGGGTQPGAGGQPGAPGGLKIPGYDVSIKAGPLTLSPSRVPEAAQTALRTYDGILAATRDLRNSFSDEELTRFTGFLQYPMQRGKQIIGSVPGMEGFADKRYAAFRALMGRLQGTAFGEGGKQLTPFEYGVVEQYTPTGKESGGVTELKAKLNALEKFTLLRRNLTAFYAQRGIDPATVNAEEWDASMRGLIKQDGLGAKRGPLNPDSGPRRVRVRDKKNPKRTGTMTLKPGEQPPADVEIIE